MKIFLSMLLILSISIYNAVAQDADMQGYKTVKVKIKSKFNKSKTISLTSDSPEDRSKRTKETANLILDSEEILKELNFLVLSNPKATYDTYIVPEEEYFKTKEEAKVPIIDSTSLSLTDVKSDYILNFSIDSLFDSPFDNPVQVMYGGVGGLRQIPIWILRFSLYERTTRKIVATGEIEDYRKRLNNHFEKHLKRFIDELEYE